MTTTVPPRAAVPKGDTWDTESIFASPADWDAAYAEVEAALPDLAGFAGRLTAPDAVADYLAAIEPVQRLLGKVLVYASLNYSVDTVNQDAAARADRARGLFARVQATLAFAEPELLAQTPETLARWTTEEPRLAVAAHYFDTLARRAPHVRSAEVEAILKQAGEPFGAAASIHGVFTNTDMTFEPASDGSGIAQGNIGALLTSPDRTVRETAWRHYADAHLAAKNTLAACLAAGVKQDVFLARARRYDSALDAALAPNHIPTEVFHRLIETFKANLPTWHRYWRLRKRALGVDTLRQWDVKAPLTGKMPTVAYDQAVEWIAEGMAPLGTEYVDALRRGSTTERWVDKYPNVGKRMGAFSSGTPDTHPFINMSFNDDVFGLSTLAHELGHSLHSYLSWRNQPYLYARYGLFAAEVASNFNQALVRAHLLEKFADDREFLIALIEEAMSNFHRYFFIMPTLARFELEIHDRVWNGQALTATTLTDRMADLFAEGFGGEVAMDGDDRARVGSTWMQFSTHLYSNFYVFQYATGISGAHALADRVRTGGQPAADAYLGFLKAGGSKYPLDALRDAGVDLSTAAPVEQTFAVLSGYVDRLEELV